MRDNYNQNSKIQFFQEHIILIVFLSTQGKNNFQHNTQYFWSKNFSKKQEVGSWLFIKLQFIELSNVHLSNIDSTNIVHHQMFRNQMFQLQMLKII